MAIRRKRIHHDSSKDLAKLSEKGKKKQRPPIEWGNGDVEGAGKQRSRRSSNEDFSKPAVGIFLNRGSGNFQLFTSVAKGVVVEIQQAGGRAFVAFRDPEGFGEIMAFHGFLESGQVDAFGD